MVRTEGTGSGRRRWIGVAAGLLLAYLLIRFVDALVGEVAEEAAEAAWDAVRRRRGRGSLPDSAD